MRTCFSPQICLSDDYLCIYFGHSLIGSTQQIKLAAGLASSVSSATGLLVSGISMTLRSMQLSFQGEFSVRWHFAGTQLKCSDRKLYCNWIGSEKPNWFFTACKQKAKVDLFGRASVRIHPVPVAIHTRAGVSSMCCSGQLVCVVEAKTTQAVFGENTSQNLRVGRYM